MLVGGGGVRILERSPVKDLDRMKGPSLVKGDRVRCRRARGGPGQREKVFGGK